MTSMEQLTRATASKPTLVVDPRVAAGLLCLASAGIFGLGLLRELVVPVIGTETLLLDLRHIWLDAERSLPAWYSSLLLFTSALLLFAIARLTGRQRERDVSRWYLLSLVFLLMSIDEIAGFHEALIEPLRDRFGLSGILHYAWVIPGSAAVIALGAFFVPFLFRLPRATGIRFALAGAIYVGGALGLEFVGGYFMSGYGPSAVGYIAASTIEEGMELAGLTLFVVALLRHLTRDRTFRLELLPATAADRQRLANRPA